MKRAIKEEPISKPYGRKAIEPKYSAPAPVDPPEMMLYLENYYYGTVEGTVPNGSAAAVKFRAQVSVCSERFVYILNCV